MHRTDGRLYISSPNVSPSPPSSYIYSHFLSPSFGCTCRGPSKNYAERDCVSLKLQLDCGFLGNSPDFYAHSLPPSVAPRDSFSRIDVYFRRISLPRRYRQTPLISLSLSLFQPSPCHLSRKRRWDLTLCGSDVFRASRRATWINRAPICRYALSTRAPLHCGGNRWYFANRLNALLNDADTRQTPCPTNAIIATQYYYISGANVLRC